MSAPNIPGNLFSIVQGARARPMQVVAGGHPAPMSSVYPVPNVPNVPGRADGGPLTLAQGLQALAAKGLDSPDKVYASQEYKATQTPQVSSTPSPSPAGGGLRASIDKYAQSPLAKRAMLMASYLEGGNGPDATTWGVGDSGRAHGAFQVRADAHPNYDVNRADDADYNADYMSNDYNLAAERVNRENPGLYEADPARAGAMTAYYAEKPTNMYAEDAYRKMHQLAVGGHADGGDVSLPNVYSAMAQGAPSTAAPPPEPAPSGGNPVMGATDPLGPILMQIAQQYQLVDANGQPDLEAAKQIYMQNPTMFAGGGDATGQAPLPAAPAGMSSNIPGVPGQLYGGSVAGYGHGGSSDTFTAGAPGTPGGPPVTGGGGDPNIPATTDTSDDFYINGLVGTGDLTDFGAAQSLWQTLPEDQKQRLRIFLNDKYTPGGGTGGSNAAAMAGVAQRADEFAKTMAFDQQKEASRQAELRQSIGSSQETAMQDFYNKRELLKNQRAQIQTERATAALNAWSQNVGHANVPGIGNYSLAGGQAAETAVQNARPLLRLNPAEAMGQIPDWTDNPAPNIPGVNYGQG